jgi:hypothetical protein
MPCTSFPALRDERYTSLAITALQNSFCVLPVYFLNITWNPLSMQIGYLQTWLLYHNALSSGVVIEDVLKHARKTKEMAGDEVSHAFFNL